MDRSQFDPYDKSSWYFGGITRNEADQFLKDHEDGVFLVRDSTTLQGDFVLCVHESARETSISHYIINRVPQESGEPKYKIGEQNFPDMPSLLNFYKLHYLESTPLIRPAPRQLDRVITKFDFPGADLDTDLPFKKGETLWVIRKSDDEMWWTAKNSVGQEGQIPANYVEPYTDELATDYLSGDRHSSNDNRHPPSSNNAALQRKLPAFARVKQERVPNAYDKSALRLKIGDIIKVTKINPSGTWEGELNGKTGHFPFTYIEWIDSVTGSPSPGGTTGSIENGIRQLSVENGNGI